MIKEINARQIGGDPDRRWYSSEYFDLIVWFNKGKEIIGFQLCYDKERNERAITWKETVGYLHSQVDDGES